MKYQSYKIILILLTIYICYSKSTAVEDNGALKIKGNKFINKNEEIVTLNGMSLFWSQWYGNFYTKNTIKWLINDWKIEIIRAAMAVNRGGYIQNPDEEKQKVETVIQAAIDLGIYVIIDWHIENSTPQETYALTFFEEMARKYGKYDNVLFEPYNEPGPNHEWTDIKDYHEKIIKVIRPHSSNIIICGTQTWSQDVDKAADNPIENHQNIAYTLHFYASTHGESLRSKADYALKKGLALFITEWGTCSATGNGTIDFDSANIWLNWAKENNIGTTNWGVYDKNESCASLVSGVDPKGPWGDSELSTSGTFMKKFLSDGVTEVPEDQDEGSKNSNGCCSWASNNECGETTTYCKANESQCQVCGGHWVPGTGESPQDEPTEEEPTETPEEPKENPEEPTENPDSNEKGCCSWDGKRSCSKTTDYCKSSKFKCESHCSGEWMIEGSAPEKADGCCSWNGGLSCPSTEGWCNIKEGNCTGSCNGTWKFN